MPKIQVSVATQGAAGYRDLTRRLRSAGNKDLRAALRKRITDAGMPVVQDVRAAVRRLQVTGTGGGGRRQRREFLAARARTDHARLRAARRGAGLRQEIAVAIGLSILPTGVRIVANAERLPPGQRMLPALLNSRRGWEHQVFGRTPRVHQRGAPYFGSTIKPKAPRFRAAVQAAVADTNAEIQK